MSQYEINSSWMAIDENGSVAQIWLDKRWKGKEVWYWLFHYSNFTGIKHGWGWSKRSVKEEASKKLCSHPIFRRMT